MSGNPMPTGKNHTLQGQPGEVVKSGFIKYNINTTHVCSFSILGAALFELQTEQLYNTEPNNDNNR